MALIGMLGFFGALIMLVVHLIKRKPKKKTLIAPGLSFVLFFAGGAMLPGPEDDGFTDDFSATRYPFCCIRK